MSWTPVVPRKAACIILVTRDGRVLVGERSERVAFLAGFLAFPGGRVEDSDAAVLPSGGDEHDAYRAAALRELVEECGVLYADGHLHPVPAELRERPIAELHAALGIPGPAASELAFAGRWITPEAAPQRFDTRFFLAVVNETCEAAPSPEFAWARFEPAAALLAAWRRFEVLISPPTRYVLDVLALGLDGALDRLVSIPAAEGRSTLEFQAVPGIGVIPLRTPTLPPARHTNTYILGEARLLVVDPATPEDSEREVLLGRLRDRHALNGATVEAIVLTHHHVDHVGATMWLAAALGAPIWAHAATKALLADPRDPEGGVRVDRTLEDGELLDLGPWSGGGRFLVEVLHTPGHAPGHVVLVDRREHGRSMIVGDMVASVGTIIIDPPEGDMGEYLRQLRRLRAMPNAILFPAHGGALIDGHAKLDHYVAHRLTREAKVLAALEQATGPATPRDLLPRAYDDTPPELYPLAARSCLAHLAKLVEDGRATQDGDHFTAVPTPS